jgi:hypothetical protein
LQATNPSAKNDFPTRRDFLERTAVAGGAALALGGSALTATAVDKPRRPKVAAIFTEFTPVSHAHVLLENFLEAFPFNGQMMDPPVDVVSFWGDQWPDHQMGRQVARDYGIPIFDTIAEALCLGGKELAVDAILGIGENGRYPRTHEWVVHYPRKRFFDECVAVMQRSQRFIPYFNDKQFSHRWDWAKEMYDTSRELGIPLMAGSSVPLAQQVPPLNIPPGSEMVDAVMIHGGEFENYGIHALETLQSIVEFRQGGETGISQIEVLYDQELWKGARTGKWNFELAAAAMELELGKPYTMGQKFDEPKGWGPSEPHGILLTYKDGFKAAVLKIGAYPMRWQFACRLKGENQIRSTVFNPGPWQNRNLFKALCHAIQHFFVHGKSPYPVERVLLANGAILSAVDAYFQRGRPLATPHLEFAYAPRNFEDFRENGESWLKITPPGTPWPKGIAPIFQPK